MKQLILDIDQKILNESEEVLNEMGLDITSAIKVMLKRITRDGNASFLFDSSSIKKNNSGIILNSASDEEIKMTKNKAINLFRNKGALINGEVTFASKNKSAYNYWANPSFEVLNDNWFLILNDNICHTIYLFEIPSKSINSNDLVARADMPEKVDLQIMYADASFTDTRSKISFVKYLKDSISY